MRPITEQGPRASLMQGECDSCGYERTTTPPWTEPYPPCSPFLTLAELDDCYERRYEDATQHFRRLWHLWVYTQHGPYGVTTFILSERARAECLQVLRLWEESQRLLEADQLCRSHVEDGLLAMRAAAQETIASLQEGERAGRE
ncbi:MAG: hypothetical protein M1826_005306 [Phylliscum demangeonii]|nr:MAG: hypothetical protein M1826_005306 [Phylliscum demangeonii]